MDLRIPNEFAGILQQKASAAGFDDVAQYVVYLVENDEPAAADPHDQAWTPEPNDPRILQAIDEGLASGEPREVTPEFWREICDDLEQYLAVKAGSQ